MKQLIKYSFILLVSVISSNVLADWTMPGSGCVMSYKNKLADQVAYDRASIMNNQVRPADNSKAPMMVVCTMPAHINYGSKLDMDFVVENNSDDDQEVTCTGYTQDADLLIVQKTYSVSAKKGLATLKASQYVAYSDNKPVTIRAVCYIPDRGLRGLFMPSRLISVRVY